MLHKDELADNARKSFCEAVVPVDKEIYETDGKKTILVALNVQKFQEKIKIFFENIKSPIVKKPLTKLADIINESFIVGEPHTHISPKRFLIENMKDMKKKGFEILFMEHLFYDTDQDHLDRYFLTGEMSKELKSRLNKMNEHGFKYSFGSGSKITQPLWKKYDYISILEAAREAGIRIVGVDISTVYNSQKIGINSEQLDDTRIGYMNYPAFQIIKREIETLPHDKKWCALLGNSHVNFFSDTPGVAELTGVRSVYIFDQENWINLGNENKKNIDFDGEFIIEQGRAIFKGDVIIKQNPKISTLIFEEEKANTASIYKEALSDFVQMKQHIVTEKDVELAVEYLANMEILELGQMFGLKESANSDNEFSKTYYFVNKILPVNEKKPIEKNNVFTFHIENNYSGMKQYDVYISKEQLLEFSDKQKVIGQHLIHPS